MNPASEPIWQLLEWSSPRAAEKPKAGDKSSAADKAWRRERFAALLAAFSPPDFPPPGGLPVIKVTGTNGKGSVCAMLEACLQADEAAGGLPRVGLFTSPHLTRISERFRLGGQEIDPGVLNEWAARFRPQLEAFVAARGEAYRPSFFEALVLIGLHYFVAQGANLAVFEAGVGGYNDAVSLLSGPAAAITAVGFDHQDLLGGSLAEIAADKAGIVSDAAALVLGPDLPQDLQAVIAADVLPRGVTIYPADMDGLLATSLGLGGQRIEIATPGGALQVHLPLAGSFQVRNFAVVWRILQVFHAQGLVSSLDCVRGVEKTTWPGRLEYLPGEPGWLLDVAHNEHAFRALVPALDELLPFERRILLYGASQGKDYGACLPFLPRVAGEVYLLDSFYRATPAAVLAERLPGGLRLAGQFSELAVALDAIRHDQANRDKVVIVAGSVFLTGAVREALLAAA